MTDHRRGRHRRFPPDTATPVNGARTGPSTNRIAGVTGAAPDHEQGRAIRRWARANGYEVGTRGAIPAHVRAAFERAHRDAP